MFTGPVGPVEVYFYWPEAVFGNFYWPRAIGSPLTASPKHLSINQARLIQVYMVIFSHKVFAGL